MKWLQVVVTSLLIPGGPFKVFFLHTFLKIQLTELSGDLLLCWVKKNLEQNSPEGFQ